MLFLLSGTTNFSLSEAKREWKTWRIGDPIPNVKGPVVTFQADGDELSVLMAAITATSQKESSHV